MYSWLITVLTAAFKSQAFQEGFPLANPWRGCDPSCGKVHWQELVTKTSGQLLTEHRQTGNSSDQEGP